MTSELGHLSHPDSSDELVPQVAANTEDIAQLASRIDELDDRTDNVEDRLAALEAQASLDHMVLAELQVDGELSREHVAQLEQALSSSRIIGTAIGMVMASRQISQGEALEVLKQASSRSNVKLAVLCADMVHTGHWPETLRT
jgi:chromosome segregation ATPase